MVRLLYGADYLGAVPVLLLLAIILPLHGLNAALGQAMQAAHLQNEMTALAAGAVGVNLALNLALVPLLGIEGAALSLLLSSGLSALVLGWIYHRRVVAFHLGPRAAAMLLAVALPIALPLLSPAALRFPAAALGLLLLAASARLSGLIGARDLARIGDGLGLGGARPESPGL